MIIQISYQPLPLPSPHQIRPYSHTHLSRSFFTFQFYNNFFFQISALHIIFTLEVLFQLSHIGQSLFLSRVIFFPPPYFSNCLCFKKIFFLSFLSFHLISFVICVAISKPSANYQDWYTVTIINKSQVRLFLKPFSHLPQSSGWLVSFWIQCFEFSWYFSSPSFWEAPLLLQWVDSLFGSASSSFMVMPLLILWGSPLAAAWEKLHGRHCHFLRLCMSENVFFFFPLLKLDCKQDQI